jgi:hypothetical protein
VIEVDSSICTSIALLLASFMLKDSAGNCFTNDIDIDSSTRSRVIVELEARVVDTGARWHGANLRDPLQRPESIVPSTQKKANPLSKKISKQKEIKGAY